MNPKDWLQENGYTDEPVNQKYHYIPDKEMLISDAMREYTKETLNEILKQHNQQKINALSNKGRLISIDYLILDFIKQNLS